MTDPIHETIEPDAPVTEEAAPQYGVGPFSLREVVLAGVWLVAFVVSFFPLATLRVDGPVVLLFGIGAVWASGLAWILTIGLPTVALFLIVLRRLSPDGIRRVGSLGVDQFASVAFSVSALVWLQVVWETVAVAIAGGPWVRSWVIWVEVVLMLAGVVLTVFAPFIPPFSKDFEGRREVPAHRSARPVNAVVPRPARIVPEPVAAPEDDTRVSETWNTTDAYTPLVEEPVTEPVKHQAFWALAPEERDVVDENGESLFRIGPTAWALVIEDHGDRFVVRHEDGRVGHLHDVSGVTRG